MQEIRAMERAQDSEAQRNVNGMRTQKNRAMETPQKTEAWRNTDRRRKENSRENTTLPQIQQRQANNQVRSQLRLRQQRADNERMAMETDVADFHEKERNPSLMLH
ncbi:Hypothetical predicted protein [Octopus vulgaris]|uniref:Uncharacterized protein n=1 Tax=Octopus vulgaris TaxID=6645 RepID=A0AA36BUV7_OCTVU|nr:Hypothetical predicted protein [Octopus vulgaris]